MGVLSISVNLSQLKHKREFLKGKSGIIDCLIIPIEENGLECYNERVTLKLTGFQLKTKKQGSKDTHFLKTALPKEVYSVMTEEQKKEMPFMGSVVDWSEHSSHQSRESSEFSGNESFQSNITDDLPY